MSNLLNLCALGFFLGMRHATDPDHVIAVTTLVARHRSVREAALIGVVWGLGHTLTILFVGGAIIVFGWVIPPRLGLSMEFSVAAMLCLLGVLTLAGAWRRVPRSGSASPNDHPHVHPHAHGDYVHTHEHAHQPEQHPHDPNDTPLSRLDRALGTRSVYRLLRPLIVGVVHGLAGSAAIVLLIVATIGRSSWSLLYLGVFGVGTVLGMLLVTAAIGVPFASPGLCRRGPAFRRVLRLASGAVSLGFGLYLAYRIGMVDGLFIGAPNWAPR